MANTTNKTEPKNAKNTAPAGGKDAANAEFKLPNFEEWEQEQVGFAPYWNPEPGKWFYGQIVARDERDEEFKRYLVKTLMPMEAYRGPENERETVQLQVGDLFSISVYYSLAEPFDFILEHFVFDSENPGSLVPMRIKAIKEVKTKKSGQTCWTWEMLLPKEWKQRLALKREEVRKAMLADNGERAALAENN